MRLSPSLRKTLRALQSDIERIRIAVAGLIAPRRDIQDLIRAIRDTSETSQEQQEYQHRQLAAMLAEQQIHETAERNLRTRDDRQYRIQVFLVIGTWLAFAAAVIYAGLAAGQWHTMNKTYREISAQTKVAQESAYAACLNAQAAQATFFQMQRSGMDSHAATMATIKQTAAGIEAERAVVLVSTKFPKAEQLLDQRLAIPYSLKNDGKSEAISIDMKANAVLLKNEQPLHIGNAEDMLAVRYLPAGDVIPEIPTSPNENPITLLLPVKDADGKPVSSISKESQDFLNGGQEGNVYFFGTIEYSDFSGNHKSWFCNAVFIMRNRSTHQQGENEKACAKYNRQADHYTSMPSISSYPVTDSGRLSAINCKKPE